jgi:hypothetical protein
MAKQTEMVYQVVIFRSDQEHIRVLESASYDECYDRWKSVQQEWALAAKEQRPFVLEAPVVTAFSPSMIFEVALLPVMTKELADKAAKNPYAQQMSEKGFGRTFPGAGQDLLSR